MSGRRKVLIALLSLFTIGLGGLAVFISVNSSNIQAPTDTGAAGFGNTATRENFENVDRAFRNVFCKDFLSDTLLLSEKNNFDELKNNSIVVVEQKREPRQPVFCVYQIGDLVIELGVITYTKDVKIDGSEEELTRRINSPLFLQILTTGRVEETRYYFGQDPQYLNNCRTTFFHSQNDFEFANIYWRGFEGGCEAVRKLNTVIAKVVAEKLNSVMKNYPPTEK